MTLEWSLGVTIFVRINSMSLVTLFCYLSLRCSRNLHVASEFFLELPCFYKYCILLSIVCTFFIEYDAKILPACYTWKVGFTNVIHKQSIQVKRVK
jgi:hypothetical protein